jgi:hypothetical protein
LAAVLVLLLIVNPPDQQGSLDRSGAQDVVGRTLTRDVGNKESLVAVNVSVA